MDFDLGIDAFRSVREAFPRSQAHEVANNIAKLKHPLPLPESPFRFVSIKWLFKQDERAIFKTKSGECFDLKLNCRKHKSTCHKTDELFAPGVDMGELFYYGDKDEEEQEQEQEQESGDEVGILVLIRFAPEMNESGFGFAVVEGVLSSKFVLPR